MVGWRGDRKAEGQRKEGRVEGEEEQRKGGRQDTQSKEKVGAGQVGKGGRWAN